MMVVVGFVGVWVGGGMDVCCCGLFMGVCFDNVFMCLFRFLGFWSVSFEMLVFRVWFLFYYVEYSSLCLYGFIMYVFRFWCGSIVLLDCCWEERVDGVGR